MGIGFPENCSSGMVTDATIISETGPVKKEGAMVQDVMARQDKRRVVPLIYSCSQKTINIHVILNGAQRSEESRWLKKEDSCRLRRFRMTKGGHPVTCA
jgi:hypothetical protein